MSKARSFMSVDGVGVEALSAANVEALLITAMSDDQLLSDCLELLEICRPDLKTLVADAVEGIMYFCEDSSCIALKLRCQMAIRQTEKERSFSALSAAAGGSWDGFELKNRSDSQFAILSPDASEPSRVRATLFDHLGFSGHRTRDGYDRLIRDLLAEGYVMPAPGVLNQLTITAAFQEGNEALGRIDRLKRGLAPVE